MKRKKKDSSVPVQAEVKSASLEAENTEARESTENCDRTGGNAGSMADSRGAQSSVPQLGEGIYESVSFDVYRRQDSISRSDLVLAKWPAKYKYFKDNPDAGPPSTQAEEFGQAFHTRLLEPKLFQARYVESIFGDFRSLEAQKWRDEQRSEGRIILTKDQIAQLDTMAQVAREHKMFSTVFGRAGTRKELTVIAKHPGTGLLLRARLDFLPPGNAIPDIKSAMDASPEGFGKAVWNFEYGMQAAFYLLVWNLAMPNDKRDEFVFYCFEKSAPYMNAFYVTPYSVLEYYNRIIRARLYTIAQCQKTNIWPGYPDNISEFELPRYAVTEIEKASENG